MATDTVRMSVCLHVIVWPAIYCLKPARWIISSAAVSWLFNLLTNFQLGSRSMKPMMNTGLETLGRMIHSWRNSSFRTSLNPTICPKFTQELCRILSVIMQLLTVIYLPMTNVWLTAYASNFVSEAGPIAIPTQKKIAPWITADDYFLDYFWLTRF